MKLVTKLLLLAVPSSFLIGQQIDQTTIQRQTTPPVNIRSSSSSSDSPSIEASNTGLIRPILVRTKNITFFVGLDSTIALEDNPITLELDDAIRKQGGKTGIWTNSVSGGAMLDPIDLDSVLASPVFGGSWSASEYLNPGKSGSYDKLENYSTSAYALLMFQHESGINFRIGSTYAMVTNQINKTEDYSEFYPNLGVNYSYDLGHGITSEIDLSGGAHYSISDSFSRDGKNYTQYLSNWDYAIAYSLKYEIFNILLSPSYRFSYKEFFKDNENVDATFQRDDVMHTLSIKASYPIFDQVLVSGTYSHERRNSNVASDYRSHDLSSNIGISYTF